MAYQRTTCIRCNDQKKSALAQALNRVSLCQGVIDVCDLCHPYME